MFVNIRHRSNQAELMDDFSMEGEMLQQTLDQITHINKRLGGNKATIGGLDTILKTVPKDKTIHIADLGCGSGDMLRAVARYGRENNYTLQLTGIDNNEFTVNYARKCSMDYPEISYLKMNVLGNEFEKLGFDVVLATLFLHHFSNNEIKCLLARLSKNTRIGIVINDLQRSRIAYCLFGLMARLLLNPMARNDGAVSILRGFRKKELLELDKQLENKTSSIRWKWAFRYQWIIRKYERTN